jgi:hypothetical protein
MAELTDIREPVHQRSAEAAAAAARGRLRERTLRDALPGGESALRTAVWEFMRPMLSPGLAARNHDAFVLDDTYAAAVELATHRAASNLDDLELDELNSAAV